MGLGKNAIGSCSRSRIVTPPEGRFPVGTNLPESHRRPPWFARRCRWIESAFSNEIGLVKSEKQIGAWSLVTANADLPTPNVAWACGSFRCKYSTIRSPYAPFSIMGCTPQHDSLPEQSLPLHYGSIDRSCKSGSATREFCEETVDRLGWHPFAAAFLHLSPPI